ncbi:N-acetyllactosaminide beta-1,3-N-acetylglucosaminyltransferase 2 [Astyanax mexicanus]|uniref:N-acetyllactosaminide beta-1,3-N-acetylglucosaminyltransferase 2 n=1 Tax=Astyanax mexicanus TaxID=7994 RepID=UPI0020CB5790|nr:N-acetyllactosaminide beta-1,3-N-acetylglucosaminyltransferase 2 [Astyanax mexicanus]
MASFLCRYRRRILLCLCTPCILLACLFIYVALAVCLSMTPSNTPVGAPPLPPYFIASGATNSGLLAPYPINSFWKYELSNEAHWNMIQHVIDRQHNPILRPRNGILGNYSRVDNSSADLTQQKPGCFPNYDVIWSLSDYFSLPSQIQRFVISMHCRDYPVIIDQPRVCGNASQQHQAEGLMLLLAIKSQAPNFENRQAIRKTWGRSGLVKGQVGKGGQVRRVFLLAKNQSGHDLDTVKKLKEESKKFGDIIMWDFLDAFFNLTLKDILFWDWFSKNCHNTRFVFKGDDDVFLRTPVLLDYLQKVEAEARLNGSRRGKPLEEFYVGEVITSAAPLRSKTTKYYIPDSFYKGMYPSYAGGGGVVYSGALVLRLLEVSKRVHLFPIDDVYLGMCLQRLGVIPTHHPAFLTFDFPNDEGKKPCAHHTIVLVHKRSPKEMRKLWVKTQNPSYKCRKVTLRKDPEKEIEKKET